jgi:CRISPR-associated protein Cmr2
MHDPVDKVADIRGHEMRAERYASLALNEPVSINELKFRSADPGASAADRLPMPAVDGDYDNLAVAPGKDGELTVIHPFSGTRRTIRVGVDAAAVERVIQRLAPHHGGRKVDFLSLWRFAAEQLAEETGLDFEDLPAETRNPDHTLWQHLDITAALALATYSGASRATLLSFKLGPVQPFIEASRSLRDLHSSSWLLSFLTFAAIEPVLEECGPTALLFPSLRGLPLMDWWLRRQQVPNVRTEPGELARASIPHRFLAIVPSTIAAKLGERCIESARDRWRDIAAAVRKHVDGQLGAEYPGWDRLWEAQIESFFDFRVSTVDYDLSEEVQRLLLGDSALEAGRRIAELGHSGDRLPGHWQRVTKIAATLMEAQAAVRHVPSYEPPVGDVPQKCTLLGSYEQMGPAVLSDSSEFWIRFHQLNSAGEDADDPEGSNGQPSSNRHRNDRLCAVALTKRLAALAYAAPQLGIPKSIFRVPDTRSFARRAGDGFVYYAILAFDGDHMGRWLSGEEALEIGEVLHPKIVGYHQAHGRQEVLKLKRPVSPALHASFSARLSRFAAKRVPEIVAQYNGHLIYAGGDDVLAALPLTGALACARDIREALSGEDVLGMKATGSAGIAIAHYKEDLRMALQAARQAESQAKREGRDRLGITALRRSGSHVTSVCRWSYVGILLRQFELFDPRGQCRASDRWTYTLQAERAVLGQLPEEAFLAEMRRILKRSEGAKQFAGEFIKQFCSSGLAPYEFLELAQTVSFMTRGKDN